MNVEPDNRLRRLDRIGDVAVELVYDGNASRGFGGWAVDVPGQRAIFLNTLFDPLAQAQCLRRSLKALGIETRRVRNPYLSRLLALPADC